MVSRHLPHFWPKEDWSDNSPDLNSVEELSAILQPDNEKQEPAAKLAQLGKQLKSAWFQVGPSVLSNLVVSMPNRVRKCLHVPGRCYACNRVRLAANH